MGDRVWIQINSEQLIMPVLLYGHYAGEDGLQAVMNVIARTDRIGDPSYLAAQIFYEFAITLGKYEGKLGFGISSGDLTYKDDDYNDNPTVFVNADTGTITVKGVLL